MIDDWFEDWLDIDVISKKEENNEIFNDNDLSDTGNANSDSTSVL
jgi:hypothetical protein